MAEEVGEELGERLVKRCKYMPTVVEILDEWHLMCRQQFRKARFTDERHVKPNKALLARIREIREQANSGRRFPDPVVKPDVIEFAHSVFPDLSENLIRRNWQNITSCRYENEKS
jgi:hypothetical protein